MALKLGDIVLDRYVLHAKLGEGGFGEVWQAVDRQERRPVAVKSLRSSATRLDRRRFEVEAGVLAKLNHPNILELHDFTAGEDGSLLLVTELLGRDTLGDWVQKHAPSIDDVVSVGRQLCSALQAAHREGVLHRDLKPANVLIDVDDHGRPRVKVVDFGIAKLLGREQADITKTGEIIGTPGFMSPEQLRGHDVGPATDLYCLGLILFIMLEGRAPFAGDSAMELCMAHLAEPVPPVTRGPQVLKRLVAQLMRKSPEDRPGSAMAVDGVLSRMQNGEVDSAEPAREDVKGPWRIVAVTVVLLAAVGVLVWSAFNKQEAVPPRVAIPPQVVSPATKAPNDGGTREPATDARPAKTSRDTAGCFTSPPPTGRQSTLFDHATLERNELLHYLPSSYDGRTPMPLVLVFHRKHSTAEQTLVETGFAEMAEKEGFVLVLPQSGRRPHVPWIREDNARIDAWLELLESTLCLDRDRYYVVGLGEGAAGNEYVLCHHPTPFAAVVASGVRLSAARSCRRRREDELIPRLEFVNTRDYSVPIAGGQPQAPCEGEADYWSLEEYEEFVRDHHGCEGTRQEFEAHGLSCRTWNCEVPYEVCDVDGGREWSKQPGLLKPDCYGHPDESPRARIAWEFVSRHRLSPADSSVP